MLFIFTHIEYLIHHIMIIFTIIKFFTLLDALLISFIFQSSSISHDHRLIVQIRIFKKANSSSSSSSPSSISKTYPQKKLLIGGLQEENNSAKWTRYDHVENLHSTFINIAPSSKYSKCPLHHPQLEDNMTNFCIIKQ